ncbi:hypothetical protein HDV01_001316 [Terramyces sp. JEL0728]|nr:hypothetical protein HDV01_001316 [Terramyces sp. JEL0728]
MNGARVRSLDELHDSRFYVATSGEPFKKVDYLVEEDQIPPVFIGVSRATLSMQQTSQSQTSLTRRKINRSTGGLLTEDQKAEIRNQHSEKSLFGPSSKAFKIAVFENGEQMNEGVRLILNHRNCKTFEQLLKYLSSLKILKSGQVRKIYDAKSGKRIRVLNDLQPGQNIVLSSFDPFKKLPYHFIDLESKVPVMKKEKQVPKIVRFYPNGDAYHLGLGLTVTKKRFPTLSKVLDVLNSQIELVTGKIQKIYALDGTRIYNVDDLRPNGNVLVANDDPFIKLKYNVMAIQHNHGQPGLNGATLRNEYINKIRPITQRGRVRHHTESGDVPASETATKPNTSHKRKKSHQAQEEPLESEEYVVQSYTSTLKPAEEKQNDHTVKAHQEEKLAEKHQEPPREKQHEKQETVLEKPQDTLRESTQERNQEKSHDKANVSFALEKNQTQHLSRKSTPKKESRPPSAIPEDDAIKHKSGREEEILETPTKTMQSNKSIADAKRVESNPNSAATTPKLKKVALSTSKIPKLSSSRTNSNEEIVERSKSAGATKV